MKVELPPPRPGSRVSARQLLAARHAARELGADAAADALRAALTPLVGGFAATLWRGKTTCTAGGRAECRGSGRSWTGRWADFALLVQRYADEVHPKGEGLIITHGTSLWSGSADRELVARTGLFADCDGEGDWRPMAQLLGALEVAFVLVARETPTGVRWHLTIPLASPLLPPTPGDERAASRWKETTYAPALGWLLGWLSELAGLGCTPLVKGKPSDSHLGFDAATDRLLQLEFAMCRRSSDEPAPVVIWQEGLALDWAAALASTGYAPAEPAPASGPRTKRTPAAFRPVEQPENDPADELLVGALAAARCADGGGSSPAWATGHRDAAARALGGALGGYGYPPPRAGVIVRAVAWRAGCGEAAESMGTKARLVAERLARGERAPGGGALRRDFPELAAVLTEHVPLPESAPAEPSPDAPPLLSAEEATREIARVVRATLEGGRGRARVVRVTPGAGKTRGIIEGLAPADIRVDLVVPLHALAEQIAAAFAEYGRSCDAPKGVPRVRLPLSDKPACLFPEAADLLVRAGALVRNTLCRECPHREAHPVAGGPCPAYEAGVDGNAIRLLMQPVLARVLDALPNGEKNAADLVVVDESPPLVTTIPLEAAAAQYERQRGSRAFRDEVLEHIEPLVRAVFAGLKDAAPGDSLRTLATRGAKGDAARAEEVIAAAHHADVSILWRPWAYKQVSRLVIHNHDDGAKGLLRRMALVHELVGAVAEACHTPDLPALRLDDDGQAFLVVRAPWLRPARRYLDAKGRLLFLDATAPLTALETLLGPLDRVVLDVADAPTVERLFARWSSGAKGRHIDEAGKPRPDKLRGALRRLAKIVKDRGARHVGILTDKPTHLALERAIVTARNPDAEPPALLPPEFVALVAAGVRFELGHYGNLRGLDTWAPCDVLVTLGDPHPHLLDARAQAAALGLDPDAWALELCMAELVQAWGRARPVHRSTPVLLVHLGTVEPCLAAAPQWARAGVRPAAQGRPRARGKDGETLDPSTWKAERTALGISARLHAERLGLDRMTYLRAEARLADPTTQSRSVDTPSGGSKVHLKNGGPVAGEVRQTGPERTNTALALLSQAHGGIPAAKTPTTTSPNLSPLRKAGPPTPPGELVHLPIKRAQAAGDDEPP